MEVTHSSQEPVGRVPEWVLNTLPPAADVAISSSVTILALAERFMCQALFWALHVCGFV